MGGRGRGQMRDYSVKQAHHIVMCTLANSYFLFVRRKGWGMGKGENNQLSEKELKHGIIIAEHFIVGL